MSDESLLDIGWRPPAGVHAAFTTRLGGVSAAPWDSFNVATHVGDAPESVAANRKLLREKPKGIVGIGLAGMPWGSPGMETADGHVDPLDIQAWDKAGNRRPFA